MSSWGNNDNAANTPLWATQTINQHPTGTNQTNLFDNTTTDYWKTATAGGGYRNQNVAVGVFGLDANEIKVQEGVNHVSSHTGWVRRTAFTGGRAGRVQEEVLVAMNTIKGDGDGQFFPNVAISLALSTSAISAYSNATYSNSATVMVTPTLTGNTSANLTYSWQVNSGGSWITAVNGTPANTHYSGITAATFGVMPSNTDANSYKYRVVVTAADEGVTATSANVTMSVPA